MAPITLFLFVDFAGEEVKGARPAHGQFLSLIPRPHPLPGYAHSIVPDIIHYSCGRWQTLAQMTLLERRSSYTSPLMKATLTPRSDSRSPFKFENIEWTWTLLQSGTIKTLDEIPGQTEPRFISCLHPFLCRTPAVGLSVPWTSQPHSHLRAFAWALCLEPSSPAWHMVYLPLNISLPGEALPGHILQRNPSVFITSIIF